MGEACLFIEVRGTEVEVLGFQVINQVGISDC